MDDLLKAALLGIVQGLTEFLPISSTGHLVILEDALGVSEEEFGLRFDAAIHLGTLSAVAVYFRAMLRPLALGVVESVRSLRWDVTPDSRLAWLLVLGTIPGGLAGLFLESAAEDAFRSSALVALMLILFTLPLLAAERLRPGSRGVADAGPLDALVIGAAQAVALVPGVSRSGITIAAGMAKGFQRQEAAVFAFLLSGPIIAAAGFKQLLDIGRGADEGAGAVGAGEVAVGVVAAAVVGYVAIAFLVRYLRFNPLYVFIAYRLAFGALVLALVGGGVLD